jgi:2-amino-4-hydroxy-6-hydroxymethyldihydropteridine diphosphokinase
VSTTCSAGKTSARASAESWRLPAGSATEPHAGARVAIALGSNLGERATALAAAIAALAPVVSGLLVSSFHDTAPVGGPAGQPRYLNAAAVGRTLLSPRALLEVLLEIEKRHGRARSFPNAPRTLDLDLILYDSTICDEPGLQVPHPRFRERAFVLESLAEIAPQLIDPVSGKSVKELLDDLRSRLRGN